MFYAAKTSGDAEAENSPSIAAFKLNFIWPLEDRANFLSKTLVLLVMCFTVVCYVHSLIGETLFIVLHHNELQKVTECLTTSLIGIQFSMRILYHFIRRRAFKGFLKQFYKDIYISKKENQILNQMCVKDVRKVYILSVCFMCTLCFVLALPFAEAFRHPEKKPYFWLMEFPYDAQKLENYVWTQLLQLWVGITSVSMMMAEDGLISTTLQHCTMRYSILHEQLRDIFDNSVKRQLEKGGSVGNHFRRNLLQIIQQQQRIDKFIRVAENYLQFPIFVIIYFEMVLLCVVAYQIDKQIQFNLILIKYFIWLSTASVELLCIGNYGQNVTDASSQMAISYYTCNWEKVLFLGNNQSNVKLLKLIKFAMTRSQKPVYLTGLKFTILSKATIAWALRNSLSYFMFLNTMGSAAERNASS